MAVTRGDIAAVEHFHLLFLAQLGTRLDKKLYALKGGCNLRFFWKSVRYSEDMDFDVHTIAKHTLQKHVNSILESSGFDRILRSAQLQLVKFSASKQTETTQRWKIQLRSERPAADLPTKIEFFRRKFDTGIVFEPVDSEILHTYRLRPILASHYGVEAAFAQKVDALLGRTETQARDIFDLAFLCERGAQGSEVKAEQQDLIKAREIVLSVPFEQFQSQVVAYLPAEYQDYYGSSDVWNSLREKLIQSLDKL